MWQKVFVLTYLLNIQMCAKRNLRSVTYVCSDDALLSEGSCFKFVSQKKSWSEANKYCHDVYGSHLAIPDTSAKYNKIKSMASQHNSDYMWLGANDIDHNNVYQWVNGLRCCPNFWVPGQPDNGGGNQRCLGLWRNKDHNRIGFDDGGCGAMAEFVCELATCQSIQYCKSHKCYRNMLSTCTACEDGYFPVKNSSSCFDLTSSTHKKCFSTCLVVFTKGLTWENAKSICNSRGGQLYVPTNLDDDDKLRNYLEAVVGSYENFWIGGQVLQTLQEKWLSQVSPTNVRWGNIPNSLKEDACIAISRKESYRLGVSPCDQIFPFVCQETSLYVPSPVG